MKYILLGDNKKFSTTIPDQLEQINLTKDIVICCPDIDEKTGNPDILFTVDEFIVHNREDLTPNTSIGNIYIYQPRFKFSIPYGIKYNPQSNIPGLEISNREFDKIYGYDLSKKEPLLYENIKIEFNENELCDYICYLKFKYYLKEYNRNVLLSYLKNNKSNGYQINKWTEMLNFHFTKSIIGSENFNGEVYIIYSSYIYINFPNFGNSK
jgi:hypothetical protein